MRLFEGTEFDIPPRCERCNELLEDCQCGPPPPERQPADQQDASVRKEKRARGKVVTVVSGLSEPDTDMKQLLSNLKQACGSGGTLKENTIELQGDLVSRVTDELRNIGYRVKQR